MTVQTTERMHTEGAAVDERDQVLFLPRPDEPVVAYAERLRGLRANLDTLIATVERGIDERRSVTEGRIPPPDAAPLRIVRPSALAAPVEIIRVDERRARDLVDDERRWATERRQRITERRIAPDRRVGRADTRSHTSERRASQVDDRRGPTDDRRRGDRRSVVIAEPKPLLDPITWVWVLQIVAWVGIAVAALALT